jgi:hypothetical protein
MDLISQRLVQPLTSGYARCRSRRKLLPNEIYGITYSNNLIWNGYDNDIWT